MTEVIENMAPLKTQYLPEEFVDREEEAAALKSAFSNITETSSRNLHIYGPRGTGKTHLTHSKLEELPDQVNTCFILCSRHDTEYKALKQIYQEVTREQISSGYHVSDLQRRIEERTGATETVVVLDEVDFLLLNDGDSLLYYLSRIENPEKLNIITISSNHSQLPLEERTKSSLQPQQVKFPLYTGEELYEILRERAESSLISRSVHRNALTYIASKTSNAKHGLHLLQTAARQTGDIIDEGLIKEIQDHAYQKYVNELLEPFTEHHIQLHQAIEELAEEHGDAIRSGNIYSRYQERCGEDALSQRRISDYLKHLELLNLIKADYHYGGKKGKTREIQPVNL